MIVAIVALAFFRIFVTLQTQQINYFSVVGGDLELIYRQVWYEPSLNHKTSNHKVSAIADHQLVD
jgi:biopolymer transport protein ExbB